MLLQVYSYFLFHLLSFSQFFSFVISLFKNLYFFYLCISLYIVCLSYLCLCIYYLSSSSIFFCNIVDQKPTFLLSCYLLLHCLICLVPLFFLFVNLMKNLRFFYLCISFYIILSTLFLYFFLQYVCIIVKFILLFVKLFSLICVVF